MANSDETPKDSLLDVAALHDNPQSRQISGKWVVLAMIGFGVVATTTLWIYWKLHLMPFMPLQEVLVESFPESSPRVDGGQRKMHQGSPMILRIVMKVAFDPQLDVDAATKFLTKVVQVTADNQDLTDYDELHVHLYQMNPEDELRQGTFEYQLDGQKASRKPNDKASPATK